MQSKLSGTMYEIAKGYQKAAQSMDCDPQAMAGVVRLKEENLLLPYLVNYSFCCEIALKSIETLPGEGTLLGKGHKLNDLFAKLTPTNQGKLKDEFLQVTGEDLSEHLIRCSSYFVSARYNYETRAGCYNLTAMRILANGLMQSIANLGDRGLRKM